MLPQLLPELFEALQSEQRLDLTDWNVVTIFAAKWKLSIGDALLELRMMDESGLARAFAKSHQIPYIPKDGLRFDFSFVGIESLEDLMSVIAAPLQDGRLAIYSPYDDHHGYLERSLVAREMIVTERTAILDALKDHGQHLLSVAGSTAETPSF